MTISNVAARWVLDRPGVAAVILGARNADHVEVRAVCVVYGIQAGIEPRC